MNTKVDKRRYLITAILLFIVIFAAGCGASQFTDGVTSENYMFPIAKGKYGIGGSWDFLVYPMSWLMHFIAKNIVGYNYALTIVIATILIRSLAWPIYAKTNDMSLKMRLVGPEQAVIEEKYKDKTDKESMTRKQMETMQLYKKYKINMFGCFMPLLQMPIFFAFFETLRRIPYTTMEFLQKVNFSLIDKKGVAVEVTELFVDFTNLKTNLLGVDLMGTATSGGQWQRWGIYLLAVIVAGTQLATQLYTQRRTKKQTEKMNQNVPSYRKKEQSQQQLQTEKTMKIMMYMMPIMMIVFCVTSTGALSWYWVVGNIYSFTQTLISSKTGEKKLIKLKEKYDKEKEDLLLRRY